MRRDQVANHLHRYLAACDGRANTSALVAPPTPRAIPDAANAYRQFADSERASH
jgi:hypothetical protein